MSNHYVRFYVNDVKVRSTGKDKWYRNYEETTYGFKDFTSTDECILKYGKKLLSLIPAKMLSKGGEFKFSVEHVKSNKSGKTVVSKMYNPIRIVWNRPNSEKYIKYLNRRYYL